MAKKKPSGGIALPGQPEPLTPLGFSKVLVFSLYGEPSLTLRDTCGKLIDKLISICAGGPEFLPPETCRRYMQLLPKFKNFVFSLPHPTQREILVANEPIAAIRRSMEEWIWSFFGDESHPILPSYALDLTEFIARLIPGQQYTDWSGEGRPGFEVKGLVKTEPDYSASLSNDKRFKSEFTRKNPLYRVICRVPPNGAVKYQNEVIFRPGEEFMFLTGRCHLSTGFYDYVHAHCHEPYQPNLQDDFELYGEMAVPRGDNNAAFYKSRVPANWVIASVISRRGDGEWIDTPVPVPFVDVERANVVS
jgi:hypothetical protein